MTTQTRVFLVTHGYRDRDIDGIFKTKEKAEQYCKEKNASLEQLLQTTHGNRKISVVTRFHSEPIPSWLFYLEIDKYRITEYPLIEYKDELCSLKQKF
jgi:hypothetical protein